jgi:glutamate 5-kinase
MRIVVKIGTSNITYSTGCLNLRHIEKLVEVLSDIKNAGNEVILVSSGAIAMGTGKLNLPARPKDLAGKQACAAVGQCELMYTYDKLFGEYNHTVAQILLTAPDLACDSRRDKFQSTIERLLELSCLPIINENDTVATEEIEIGDNDTLSAIVAALVDADLLILLSDIDGLYTDDPRKNPDAKFIEEVPCLTSEYMEMGKGSTGSNVGTGGMNTKLIAAKIATNSGVDMVIANSKDLEVIHEITEGESRGTLFVANKDESFDLPLFVQLLHKN